MTRLGLSLRLWARKNDYKVGFWLFLFYMLVVLATLYGLVWMVAVIQNK